MNASSLLFSATVSFLLSASYVAGISVVDRMNVVFKSAYFPFLSFTVSVYFPGLIEESALNVNTLPSTFTFNPSTVYSGSKSSLRFRSIAVLPAEISASATLTASSVFANFTGT